MKDEKHFPPNDLPSAEQTSSTTDTGSAILINGFAAFSAEILLVVIGAVYSELMNADIPGWVSNSR